MTHVVEYNSNSSDTKIDNAEAKFLSSLKSHVVEYTSDRVAVMYLGRVVETAPAGAMYSEQLHPYTKALVSAVPIPHVNQSHEPLPIKGHVPDATANYIGCKFAERCPMAQTICFEKNPDLELKNHNDHFAACHFI